MTVCKSLHFFFMLLVAGVLLLVAVLVRPAAADACTDVCTCYVRKSKRIVDCSYIGLTAVPADLPADTSRLYLNGNSITTIDSNSWGANYLEKVRVLNLNNNPITSLPPGTFHNVRHIHTLQLQFCSVTTIQAGVFNELDRLKWLWLNDCAIASVDSGAFRGLARIWEIYMYNNPDLAVLPYGLFQDSPKLKHLYLHKTALPQVDCCHFVGLNKWLDIKWPKKMTLDTLDCPCDSGTSTINCNTADFPTLEGQCPIGYTFNSASRLSSSYFNVALITVLVALLHMLI